MIALHLMFPCLYSTFTMSIMQETRYTNPDEIGPKLTLIHESGQIWNDNRNPAGAESFTNSSIDLRLCAGVYDISFSSNDFSYLPTFICAPPIGAMAFYYAGELLNNMDSSLSVFRQDSMILSDIYVIIHRLKC